MRVVVYGGCLESTIEIDVKKSGNRALNTAEVSIYYGGQKVLKKITERDGKVSYQPTNVGLYEIEVKKDGYATADATLRIISCTDVPPNCTDGILNQDEEAIDCGGICVPCPTCYDGIQNQGELGIDCGGICGQCRASCFDGVKNQNELEIDCGGICEDCPNCIDGIINQGEIGVDCGGPCGSCAPTCADGIRNQGETGIDCGGPCGVCAASCNDSIKNQNEVEVDCGGICDDCPTCFDKIKNGLELGVDCGGPCGPCPPGSCYDEVQNQNEDGVDCGGLCPDCPTCIDNILNQDEEDVDCGGSCLPCPEPEYVSETCVIQYFTGYDVGKAAFCGDAKNLVVFTPSKEMAINSVLIDGNPLAKVTISDISGLLAESDGYSKEGNTLNKKVFLTAGDTYIIYIDKPEDLEKCTRLLPQSRVEKEEGSWEVRDSYCDGSPNGCYLAVTLQEQLPTCTDGIRNQNETGVDCGGPCKACSPSLIGRVIQSSRQGSGLTFILIGLLVLIVYAVYRKGVNDGRDDLDYQGTYAYHAPAQTETQVIVPKPAQETQPSAGQTIKPPLGETSPSKSAEKPAKKKAPSKKK